MEESEQINFIIDEYQDLFSDFDSRNYDKKSLSDDFLDECKKASVDKKTEGIELQILIPQKIRDEKKEELIKERLKNHFIKHLKLMNNEKDSIIKKGIMLLILGLIDLAFSTYIHYLLFNQNALILSLFYVILDPLGILLLWQGITELFMGSNNIKKDLDFYSKMSKSKITFDALKNEELVKDGSKVM